MTDTGWECPRCGTIHAPWVSECGCTPGWIGTVTGAAARKGSNPACGNFEPNGGWGSLHLCRNCGRPRYAHPEV